MFSLKVVKIVLIFDEILYYLMCVFILYCICMYIYFYNDYIVVFKVYICILSYNFLC